jgi:hypothetical protein
MSRYYPYTYEQSLKAQRHPRISGEFALEKGLWQGRRVIVRVMLHRGHAYRRSVVGFFYGTLDLTAGRDDQIGVVHPDGEVSIIHKKRAMDVYDATRTKP